jgi:peroxiredoxin
MKPILLAIFIILKTTFCFSQTKEEKLNLDIEHYMDSINKARDLWIGKPFPEFSLMDLSSKKIDNEILKNKVTLIVYWFTGCVPCNIAFPEYNRFNDSTKTNNVNFLTFTKDKIELAKQTAKKQKFQFNILPFNISDNNYPDFKSGYPLYIIVDKNGIISYIHSGGSPNLAQAKIFFDTEIYPRVDILLKIKK